MPRARSRRAATSAFSSSKRFARSRRSLTRTDRGRIPATGSPDNPLPPPLPVKDAGRHHRLDGKGRRISCGRNSRSRWPGRSRRSRSVRSRGRPSPPATASSPAATTSRPARCASRTPRRTRRRAVRTRKRPSRGASKGRRAIPAFPGRRATRAIPARATSGAQPAAATSVRPPTTAARSRSSRFPGVSGARATRATPTCSRRS